MEIPDFETLKVEYKKPICYIQFNREEDQNSVNSQMLEELDYITNLCSDNDNITILVLRGNSEFFCSGGDFKATAKNQKVDAAKLYDIWLRLKTAPFISIALVEGRVNAGGIGFVAASDIVLASDNASFSLSEMLFGLFPACVLGFLQMRIGQQKAHYMSLMTKPIQVEQALAWQLVDESSKQIEALLIDHLRRLKLLEKAAISKFKAYSHNLNSKLEQQKHLAVSTNQMLFEDDKIRLNIKRYVDELKFPWEL